MAQAKLWITADLHLNCRGVLAGGWGDRPSTSVEEHDAWVRDLLNGTASAKDTLVLLGDHAFARNAVEQAGILREFLKSLVCKNVIFINGNHDFPEAIQCLGRVSYDYKMLAWHGMKLFCCHYPMMTWPDSHHGSICCYGHTHAVFEDRFDELMPERRSLDVGLDNARWELGEYRPFEADEIVELLRKRRGAFLPAPRKTKKEN